MEESKPSTWQDLLESYSIQNCKEDQLKMDLALLRRVTEEIEAQLEKLQTWSFWKEMGTENVKGLTEMMKDGKITPQLLFELASHHCSLFSEGDCDNSDL